MAQANLNAALTGLGALGVFLLWVVMILNGTFAAVWTAATTGSFADGRPLRQTYTGIFPIDFAVSILMAFFDPLTNLVEVAPYMILFELIISIHVFYLLALVESRRARKGSWLRFPALWQAIYNCIGVAVGLPFFALLYVDQDSTINVQSLAKAEAQALPFTAIWNWVLPILMFLPAWTSLSPTQAQLIVATWFLTPLFFPGFQMLASRALSKLSYKGINKPTTVAYIITGLVSAVLHIGLVFSVIFSAEPDVSLVRVYIPRFSAVQWGQTNTLVEGAHLFIQLDFWMTILLVLILGIYMIQEPIAGQKARSNQSVWTLVAVTGICGPGAGMAYASYLKESRVESATAWTLPAVHEQVESQPDEGERDALTNSNGNASGSHVRAEYGSFGPFV